MDFKILFCLGCCKLNPSYGLICYGFAEEDLVTIENCMSLELCPHRRENKNSVLTVQFARDERDIRKHENKD